MCLTGIISLLVTFSNKALADSEGSMDITGRGYIAKACQRVFDLVMHMLDRSGLFPVPIQQLGPFPWQIGEHGMMMTVAAAISRCHCEE